MKALVVLFLLLADAGSVFAEEITLTSKDGRKISATLIQVHGDSVEFRRQDGSEFTIAFEKLDGNTVEMLNKIALEEKEAAIAEQEKKMQAEEAEQARIPKFPEKPKTPADLPEKIVITMEDGKELFYAFDRVKTFFVEPAESSESGDAAALLSVSMAFGGGEIMTSISHSLTDGNVSMKLIARTDKDSELPEPISMTIPSKIAKSSNGTASVGFFTKRLSGNVTEIILYDFQVVP